MRTEGGAEIKQNALLLIQKKYAIPLVNTESVQMRNIAVLVFTQVSAINSVKKGHVSEGIVEDSAILQRTYQQSAESPELTTESSSDMDGTTKPNPNNVSKSFSVDPLGGQL